MPVTREQIRRETIKDEVLRKVCHELESSSSNPNETQTKYNMHDGCIFYGMRVVIPKSLQQTVLNELHDAHLGMTKMKAMARSYCFWNGIDADIEMTVKKCRSCCLVQKEAAKVPVHSWEFPSFPFQRIHIDYAGPFMNTNFLLIVDAYSKWPEIFPTRNTDTKTTIRILRRTFARFGIPVTMVSDNGPQFRSNEMDTFTKQNGIRHKFTAPYHPASNGQAERYVQMLKKGLRCMADEPGDLDLKLDRLLIQYRKAPNSTTGQSPAELMFGRQIRTKLDLMKRDLTTEMNENSSNEPVSREFVSGDKVQIRSYRNLRVKWEFGTVFARCGLTHYDVEVDGRHGKCHVNQMRRTLCEGGDDIHADHSDSALEAAPSTSQPHPTIMSKSAETRAACFSTDSSVIDSTSPMRLPVGKSTPSRQSNTWQQSPQQQQLKLTKNRRWYNQIQPIFFVDQADCVYRQTA
ncbi:uncharacterized protein K02A2.6-like [Photinus pyralis]|uniref:uncharacterized protein K02A2.6-like n=1 Tax=Photinus pyralis TaxID=7054 RepID=UPI001266E63D|nr:uncharacterized protein K02A2.6-like [Photinus pyralis]